VYIFLVAHWPHCYPSFAQLMTTKEVRKFAHYSHVDVTPLQRRFPGVVVLGAENLTPIAQAVAKAPMANNELATYARSILRRSMPAKDGFDHSKWENANLTHEQLIYAAADSIVVYRIVALSLNPLPAKAAVGRGATSFGDGALSLHSNGIDDNGEAASDGDSDGDETKREAVTRRGRRKAIDEICRGFITGDDDDTSSDGEGDKGSDETTLSLKANALVGDETALFEYCATLIRAYAATTRTDLVRLPRGLSSGGRKRLHDLCSSFGLWHASMGISGMDSPDRFLTFCRRSVFQPLQSAVAEDAVGCVVASSPTEPSNRGIVDDFDRVKVLQKPEALVFGGASPRTENLTALHAASGVLPSSRALAAFPALLNERLLTEGRLSALGHADLHGRLQREANSWQLGIRSSFQPQQPSLGMAFALPASQFQGVFRPGVLTSVVAPSLNSDGDGDAVPPSLKEHTRKRQADFRKNTETTEQRESRRAKDCERIRQRRKMSGNDH
jgi:hypothetical protein